MKVEVVPYDEKWSATYVLEANVIRNIIKSDLVSIMHIGSTAVPGLAAKPVVDILIVVRDVNKLDDLNPIFEENGYECLGENGIKGRRFFFKRDERVHVHAYDKNNYEVIEPLVAFYDYLKDNHEIAKKYSDFKLALAKKYPDDLAKYTKEKDAYTKDIKLKAIELYRNKSVEQI